MQGTGPRQGAAPVRQAVTSLNASASTMSTEQVMKALEDIMMIEELGELR